MSVRYNKMTSIHNKYKDKNKQGIIKLNSIMKSHNQKSKGKVAYHTKIKEYMCLLCSTKKERVNRLIPRVPKNVDNIINAFVGGNEKYHDFFNGFRLYVTKSDILKDFVQDDDRIINKKFNNPMEQTEGSNDPIGNITNNSIWNGGEYRLFFNKSIAPLTTNTENDPQLKEIVEETQRLDIIENNVNEIPLQQTVILEDLKEDKSNVITRESVVQTEEFEKVTTTIHIDRKSVV